MSVIGSNIIAGASGQGSGGGPIDLNNSLRFRSVASAYLSRTFATPTSSTIWTWSAWIKRGGLTGTYRLFGASTTTFLTFNSSDQLNLTINSVSAATSTAVFRDPSAWYHIVYQQNGSAQTIYVNNVSVATGTTAASIFNTAIAHQIGAANTTNYFDGHMTEVNFIDGQALTPSSFGLTSTTTAVWIPKNYTGSYGTNGFYLRFTDNSALTTSSNVGLGKDFSVNGNYFATNNISITSGVTYDSMTDVPTLTSATASNYATLNPLKTGTGATLDSGNLNYSCSSNAVSLSTIGMSSGKWYCEYVMTSSSVPEPGLAREDVNLNSFLGSDASSWMYYGGNGQKYTSSVGTAYGATYTVNDIIGIAFDADAGTLTFYKNNTSQGTAFTGLTNGPYFFGCGAASQNATFNFGQRPFAYTAPANHLALNTFNIPAGTIVTSGSFTGNSSTNGPFIYLNGVPTAMTINGNAVTFGTHADKLSNGFKVRSSSSSYNQSGSNTYSITTTSDKFKFANAQPNP